MGCDNKDNCVTDMGRGCTFCQCGEQTEARKCEGCYKLHSYDWLDGFPEMGAEDIFEVRFKNTRKGFYKNANNLPLAKGDVVAVEASPGHDIGIISLTGDMVARQMRRVGFNPQNGEFKKIYRKAKPYDIEKWQEAIALEHETMIRSRQIAADMRLQMKIGDVEYQGDRIKAIFYYIADERVDFRELIKVFADQFRIRVEMKQIGARQEAGRIGGLGSCGRELCCASWISGFVSVTTNAARHQEISLNPQKLAGQCGKLKCCLVYELDTYMDARKEMPRVNQPLQAMDGDYHHVKSDILSRTMSFSTSPSEMVNLVTLPFERVREIMDMNRKGQKIDRLQDYNVVTEPVQEPDFVNVIGEESITRFDKQASGRRQRGGGRGQGQSTEGNSSNADNRREGGNDPRNRQGRGDRQRDQRQGANRGEAKPENRNENRNQRGNRGENKGENRNEGRNQQGAQGGGNRRNNPRGNRPQGGSKPHGGNRSENPGGNSGGKPGDGQGGKS